MKHLIYSTIFTALSLTSIAQVTQKREVTPFNKIEVSGAASVYYTQSDTLSLQVIAVEGEINNIYTTITDHILSIKAKGTFKEPYKIYVSANSLNQITTSGASKLNTTNKLLCDSLSLDATGASDMDLDVNTKKINIILSGASQITVNGTTDVLQGNISGASSLKAYKLQSSQTNITASGASSAKVFSNDKIYANATGSSTIKFKGDPKDVSAEASSSSSIERVVGDDVNKKSGSSDKDSTTFNFKKKKFVIINKEKDSDSEINTTNRDEQFKHWRGFGIGFNFFSSQLGDLTLNKNSSNMDLNTGKSSSIFFNPIQRNFHLYKNYVNLVTGLGIQWNGYNFNKRVTIKADSDYTYARIDSLSKLNYKENALRNTYLNIPLLLEFNTNLNPKKALHISFGVIGGIKLGSRTRQQYTLNSVKTKLVERDNFNQNLFRLNAHASIGYSNLTFFADYALTPLFQSGKGQTVYPFTIGMRLIPF